MLWKPCLCVAVIATAITVCEGGQPDSSACPDLPSDLDHLRVDSPFFALTRVRTISGKNEAGWKQVGKIVPNYFNLGQTLYSDSGDVVARVEPTYDHDFEVVNDCSGKLVSSVAFLLLEDIMPLLHSEFKNHSTLHRSDARLSVLTHSGHSNPPKRYIFVNNADGSVIYSKPNVAKMPGIITGEYTYDADGHYENDSELRQLVDKVEPSPMPTLPSSA